MYVKKSVPLDKSVPNPGAVTAKSQEITIFDTNDVLYYPPRDGKNVLMVGDIVLKPGAEMIKLYLTPSTQEPTYVSEGDEDAESFTHTVVGMHPGNSLEAKEFSQNWLGRPIIAIWTGCDNSTGKEVYGLPCAPLKMKTEFVANNEKTGFTFTFASIQKTRYVPATYRGALSYASPNQPEGYALDITRAKGTMYELASSSVANTIEIASTDFEHGESFSLIGGGGSAPAVLENGTSAGGTVMLKDGTPWTAVKDAVISLEVFDDGTTKYFRETGRK